MHRPSVSIEPITKAQKSFYKIRTLHEKGKSKAVVSKAKSFLSAFPDDELSRPVQYYLALHSERLGQKDLARKYYHKVVDRYPGSGWAQLAEASLKAMNE